MSTSLRRLADVYDPAPRSRESGQILISLLLMMALFLLAIVGFSVDLTNLWFQRQSAQSAADAACQAGAMDMSALVAGLTLPNMGFTPGTSGNCSANPGATVCSYAKANGFNGSGLTSVASNSVAWSFPASVSGVTAPPSSITDYPFLNVTITQNVQTHFLFTLEGSRYQKVTASCTCGLVQEKEAAPMIVLNPTANGAFTYSGGASFNIVGGPQRSLQVNSNNATAIACSGSGLINTSQGGPKGTGSDVATVGGPSQAPTCGGRLGFSGGSTGQWHGSVLPIGDPYAGVGPPASMKSLAPVTGTGGTWVSYHQDGCPDSRTAHYPTTRQCMEYGPGYYPNGIQQPDGYSTMIFLPGVYYLNGSMSISGSEYLRNATPCKPSCGPVTPGMTSRQTDGVMFYFLSGSFSLSGCTGCGTSIDSVSSTALTCDGSTPSASLNMPANLNGNVLIAQCTQNGTYWDSGGDTSDSRGSPGERGLLIFQDHADVAQPQMSGSGTLAFSGALYFHSAGYTDLLNISGAGATGTFILGQIVTDKVNLSGSGAINLALNPSPSTELLKVGLLQ